MKINFTLYLLWRLVKGTAVVVLAPFWIPGFLVLYCVGITVEQIVDWFKRVKWDWEERQK